MIEREIIKEFRRDVREREARKRLEKERETIIDMSSEREEEKE